MYRTLAIAAAALAIITLPAGPSLAFGHGGGAGRFSASMTSVAPASHVPPKSIRGTATPLAKKLSGKAGKACFRACMHGVSGAGWGNFCDYSCYGG
jgi:hypothetical protein